MCIHSYDRDVRVDVRYYDQPVPYQTILRTIATARIVLPGTIIRLAAGRQTLDESEQAMCFLAGANAVFTGEQMLTTPCTCGRKFRGLDADWDVSHRLAVGRRQGDDGKVGAGGHGELRTGECRTEGRGSPGSRGGRATSRCSARGDFHGSAGPRLSRLRGRRESVRRERPSRAGGVRSAVCGLLSEAEKASDVHWRRPHSVSLASLDRLQRRGRLADLHSDLGPVLISIASRDVSTLCLGSSTDLDWPTVVDSRSDAHTCLFGRRTFSRNVRGPPIELRTIPHARRRQQSPSSGRFSGTPTVCAACTRRGLRALASDCTPGEFHD